MDIMIRYYCQLRFGAQALPYTLQLGESVSQHEVAELLPARICWDG